jgi:hypothetical protein
MIRSIALAALLLLPLAGHGAAVPVKLPAHATVGTQLLVLNGAGVRTTLFFKVYVLALYLPSRTSLASEVLALPGPARITMVLLRDVTARQLTEALEDGVGDNHTAAELDKLRGRLNTLSAVMAGIKSARRGSVITLDHVPGAGTVVGLDGTNTGPPIPGDDFYRALLRIWLGDDPADSAVKKALLGAP